MNRGMLFSLCICLGVTLFVLQADNLPEMPVQNEPMHDPATPEPTISNFLAELVVSEKAPQPIIAAAAQEQEPGLPRPEVAELLPATEEPAVADVPVCHVSFDGTVVYDCMKCRHVMPEQEVPQEIQQESIVIEVSPEESELVESEEPELLQSVESEEPRLSVIQEIQEEPEMVQPPIEFQQLDLEKLRIEEPAQAPEEIPEKVIEEPIVEPVIEVVIEPVDIPAYEPAIEVAVQAKKRTPLEEKLLSAARNGKSTTVKYALKNPHVNVDVTDDEGRTPLMLGVLSGHAGTVKVILHNNPDMTAVSTTQETALSIAREQGAHKIEKLLLKAGAQE